MFKRLVMLPAILSIAGLLMAADSAFAQRGGGGHGGGGHGGGGHGGGGHGGGGHGGGGHGGGGHGGGGHYSGGHGGGGHGGGYYGGGHHHGGYYGGGVYYGGLGLYGYDPWYDSYAYPRYSYYSAPAVQYYSPPTQYYAQPAPVVNDYANIRVIVPDPQARVWFDGNGTTSIGTERLFNTPALTMGSTYSYRIRASWMQGGQEVTQERTVSVTPAQTAMVDFSR